MDEAVAQFYHCVLTAMLMILTSAAAPELRMTPVSVHMWLESTVEVSYIIFLLRHSRFAAKDVAMKVYPSYSVSLKMKKNHF